MHLLECDGKALLARYGVPIPRGALWPELPPIDGPLVVKAQVPAGKRGRQGGIRFAESREQAAAFAEAMRGGRVGEHEVAAVYVEERLEIARELYVAVLLDRDERCLTLLASPEGGMAIEEVEPARILKLPIDPLLGLRPFHLAEVGRFLADGRAVPPGIERVIEVLYRAAVREDAELIEVNPLVLSDDGRVVAADAKVSLDDNAAFRRAAAPPASAAVPESASALEQAIAATGAVGVEIDPAGDVVAVMSGAGLMMATLDLLRDAGVRVRCVVDLGGTVLAGGDGLRRVFEAVAQARPRLTFLNAFLQTALCDEFARELAAAHAGSPLEGRAVVRLKGRRAEEGRAILAACGFEVHEDLEPAIRALQPEPDGGA